MYCKYFGEVNISGKNEYVLTGESCLTSILGGQRFIQRGLPFDFS
ncbi:hypothetical protein D1BOALGB6SA_9635 [Olavius sp. associated proteobacterium Delta 1]|nr:hypothetical protein D1BOALGB6SA_9635 [Olavius sp. associated proteobacterium Delta 1]